MFRGGTQSNFSQQHYVVLVMLLEGQWSAGDLARDFANARHMLFHLRYLPSHSYFHIFKFLFLWATSSNAQALFPDLHSGTTPGKAYGVLGNKSISAACKTNAVYTTYFLYFLSCLFLDTFK